MEAGIPGESGVHVTLIYIRRDLDVVTGPLQSTEEPLAAEMVKSLTIVQVSFFYHLLGILNQLFPIVYNLSYIIYLYYHLSRVRYILLITNNIRRTKVLTNVSYAIHPLYFILHYNFDLSFVVEIIKSLTI